MLLIQHTMSQPPKRQAAINSENKTREQLQEEISYRRQIAREISITQRLATRRHIADNELDVQNIQRMHRLRQALHELQSLPTLVPQQSTFTIQSTQQPDVEVQQETVALPTQPDVEMQQETVVQPTQPVVEIQQETVAQPTQQPRIRIDPRIRVYRTLVPSGLRNEQELQDELPVVQETVELPAYGLSVDQEMIRLAQEAIIRQFTVNPLENPEYTFLEAIQTFDMFLKEDNMECIRDGVHYNTRQITTHNPMSDAIQARFPEIYPFQREINPEMDEAIPTVQAISPHAELYKRLAHILNIMWRRGDKPLALCTVYQIKDSTCPNFPITSLDPEFVLYILDNEKKYLLRKYCTDITKLLRESSTMIQHLDKQREHYIQRQKQ